MRSEPKEYHKSVKSTCLLCLGELNVNKQFRYSAGYANIEYLGNQQW